MTEILGFLTPAAWALCAMGIAWYCMNIARQLTYVTLADGRRQERKLPLVFRLLLPFVPNLDGALSRPSFDKARTAADRKLVAAGFESLLSGREFVAIKLLMPVVCGAFWCAALRLAAVMNPGSEISKNFMLLLVLGLVVLYYYPLLWLKRALSARHRAIQQALPFVLDLLTLSVEAGMDFMSALQRNCERRKLDPLNEELIRMTREIQVGIPRRTALRNMAQRVDLADLRSVTSSLVQADELGVSIGAILRIQSDQMRSRRFDRAEKLANEAPVKMLGPLMLCIFPAVFIILLAPILQQTLKSLF
ncbi:MAG: type II secretion system F family protein [Verrucomicrobiota bacterium]|jgi:tight adherence protein C|nr:type II secretion system F family protein [Verrucomicrobiota bacterium]